MRFLPKTLAPAAAGLVAAALALAPATGSAQPRDPDPWLGRDKALHFGASAAIAGGAYAIAATQFRARYPSLLLGGGIALAAGAAKEALDLLGYGDPSWKDMTWNVIGAVAGLGVAWGLDLLIRGVSNDHPLLGAPSADAPGTAAPVRTLGFSW